MFSPDGRYIPISGRGRFKEDRKAGAIAELHEGMSSIMVTGRLVRMSQSEPAKTRYGEAILVPCLLRDVTGEITLIMGCPDSGRFHG